MEAAPAPAGSRSSRADVDKALSNLDAAEAALVQVLDAAAATAAHVHSLGKGHVLDRKLVGEQAARVMGGLEEVHDRISQEVPSLVKYIPFERSSYGACKDAEIADLKLRFAVDYLAEMLDQAASLH